MRNEGRELDKLIESIGKWIIQDEERPEVLNPMRMQQTRFAHSVLERLAKGTDMKVTGVLHEPYRNMGSICVEGDNLEFEDCKWLARAVEFASNVEIFPISNGRLKMVLTFHMLTVPMNTK